MQLRKGETTINLPSEDPTPRDYAELDCLQPRPGEYFAVMDPPRYKVLDGRVLLREQGDGWRDKHQDGYDEAERKWEVARDEALERIAIYEADKNSRDAYRMAFAAAEVARAAYARLQVMMDPEPPGSAMETRPDTYTVARVGEGVPLEPMDRVAIAPYSARRIKNLFGIDDVVLVGKEDFWDDITVLKQDPEDKEWYPLSNWLGIGLYHYTQKSGVQRARKRFIHAGLVVMAGPDAESLVDDEVVIHKDRTKPIPGDVRWFITRFGPWDDKHVVFTREVDGDGFRRVLAKLGERTDELGSV